MLILVFCGIILQDKSRYNEAKSNLMRLFYHSDIYNFLSVMSLDWLFRVYLWWVIEMLTSFFFLLWREALLYSLLIRVARYTSEVCFVMSGLPVLPLALSKWGIQPCVLLHAYTCLLQVACKHAMSLVRHNDFPKCRAKRTFCCVSDSILAYMCPCTVYLFKKV